MPAVVARVPALVRRQRVPDGACGCLGDHQPQHREQHPGQPVVLPEGAHALDAEQPGCRGQRVQPGQQVAGPVEVDAVQAERAEHQREPGGDGLGPERRRSGRLHGHPVEYNARFAAWSARASGRPDAAKVTPGSPRACPGSEVPACRCAKGPKPVLRGPSAAPTPVAWAPGSGHPPEPGSRPAAPSPPAMQQRLSTSWS